jgi:AbrB family looped-hinge helix DNA binding protein
MAVPTATAFSESSPTTASERERTLAGLERLCITVVISGMAIAHSKLTAQGQISVPACVRQRLGVGPGSVLEWDEDGENVVVRRAGRFSSEDIHRALFPAQAPEPRTVDDMKRGIWQHIRNRHARG